MSFLPNHNLTFDPSGDLVLSVSPGAGDSSNKAATTSYVKAIAAGLTPYTPSNIAINGGAINNVPIGQTTPSAGAFTNGSFTSLTAPSASMSGTLTLNGGLNRNVRTITSGSSFAMLANDDVVVVNKTTGSSTAVTLPASPAQGRRVVVKDGKGDAITNNIVISGSSGSALIDNQPSFTVNTAYGYADFTYDGTQWVVAAPAVSVLLARTVIAHYMVAMSPYGSSNGNPTVAAYTQDIQDAQAIGVDVFEIDMMGWQTPSFCNFQTCASNFFTAAQNLGTGFKLMFMIDWQGRSGESNNSASLMLSAWGNHPNYFRYNGRPVVSGWDNGLDSTIGGSDDTFWSGAITALNSTGMNPIFIPSFWNFANLLGGNQATTTSRVDTWYTSGFLNGKIGGLMNWATMGAPNSNIANNAYATLGTNHNLVIANVAEAWFAPLRLLTGSSPDPNMNVIELHGGEGMSSMWQNIISNTQTPLLHIVSWTDMTETYVHPASQATMTTNQISSWNITGDYLWSHAGYYQLHKYFIQWYKTGNQPTNWPDSMYVFYRNASRNATITGAPAGMVNNWDADGTTTLDDIYITTILTAPATLTINSGGTQSTFSPAAGLVHNRISFNVGTTQTFVLSRGGTTLITINGAPVVSSETKYYNVNPQTYYGHNP